MTHSRLSSVDGATDVEKHVSPSSDDQDAEKRPDLGSQSEPRDTSHDGHFDDASDSDEEDQPRRSTGARSIASRVVSRITTRSSVMPPPPPDGGFAAWMVVVAAHLVIMCTWGVINSFGAFQSYYATSLNRPPSDISWIGSFQVFLLFFIGTFTGRLTDAGFLRHCLVIGISLVAVGTFTAAQCTQYWQLFLAQGVCLGLGNGFLFCPAVAVTSTYWYRKRALAIGLAACGSATGGLVFPTMVRQLLPKVGFAWTMRSIGFIQVACLIVAFFCLKTRVPPRKNGSLVDLASFKELEYTFYAIGAFLSFWGLYVPFFYLPSYSRDIRGMPYSSSLNLLLILNGIGLIGRILPAFVADRVGAVNMFIPMAASSAILVYCWAAVGNVPGLYAWSCIYGITAGGIQSLFPAALSSLTEDPRKQGTRMGMTFTIVSFAVLTGPPLAGAIISSLDGSFIGAQMFAGTSLTIGTISVCLSRELKRRRKQQKLVSRV